MSDLDPAEVNPTSGTSKKPEREGLPAGYRMRADSHYVDQLSSRRVERAQPDVHAPAAEAARDRGEPRERRASKALAQLAEDIATIESAATLLAADASPMGRRVSIDLIRAQAWRASWLLRATNIVDGVHRAHFRSRPLVSLLSQVREGFAPECRLSGISLQLNASDWNANVSVDEPGFVAAVTGAVVSTLGLMGQAEGAGVTVTVETASGELRTVEVTQDDVTMASGVSARFLDPTWTDRPGGWAASVGVAAAKAVAQQHGGDATFQSGDRRGSTLRLTFNRQG